jgi:hypothetical protein
MMPAKNLSKPVTCPVCQTSEKWGEMAKHVAYKGDLGHKQWRVAHRFPASIDFGTLKRYEPKLRFAIVKEFPQS